ncbi:hypothetical protein [Pricia sp.]|uniref:hypothetical protein n=1 Tax=Pricia sp. TaxID=2268138 RepID=UPI003594691F
MKSADKQQWIFLIFIWCTFLLWEFQLQTLPSFDQNYEVRYDLMVLPVLLLITGYILYSQVKTNRKNPR